jgi:hypothetical protein
MRKKDLKKPFQEDKLVLAIERIKIINIALLTFLLLSDLSAQIPINGFCKYREYSAKQGYNRIFTSDYNNDGFGELILSNITSNKIALLSPELKSNSGSAVEKNFSSSVSGIRLFSSDNSGKRYLMVSRKNRFAGLASISKSGVVSLSDKLKTDGYPTSYDVGNVFGISGPPAALLSGSSMNGLSIIYENKKKLVERKISKEKVFSYSAFIDLDYDAFADIAAVNSIKNSIELYNNNQLGEFSEPRTIDLDAQISEFKTTDFNSDGFTDLAYIKNNRFEVLLGDSVSSFRNKLVLDIPVKPDKYVVMDFNGDGYNDIAYINIERSELYIAYGKGSNSFYPPILYLKKPGLVDLSSYIDRAGKKLAVLSSEGKVYLITQLVLTDESFSISLGEKPGAINSFDYLNDKYKDVCFIDEEENTLKILLSERRNLCRIYYSIPLAEKYENILIDDSRGKWKTFYCWSKKGYTVELVKVNFENQKHFQKVQYTDGPIEDIKLTIDRLKDRQILSILVNNKRNLLLQEIEYRDFKYAGSYIYPVVSNIDDAALLLEVYNDIYCFSKSENEVSLFKVSFNKKILDIKNLLGYKLKPGDVFNSQIVCIDEPFYHPKPAAVLVSINNKSFVHLFGDRQPLELNPKHSALENSHLRFIVDEFSGQLSLFYECDRGLECLVFHGTNSLLKENNLIESKKINDYFVSKLYGEKTFLIYSDKLKNILTFERI